MTEHLPVRLAHLLDGNDLEDKLGHTFVLTAADADDWPRQALLSVGEVLAAESGQILLTLHAGSRTTAALAASRRGLLTIVFEGQVYKLALAVDASDDPGGPLRRFRTSVAAVDRDAVAYAEVLHGIEFRLRGRSQVLDRWRKQLEALRGLDLG